MDTREVLRPYKKQRLGFEGVLVDILEPNKRNGHAYGLVFASVYAASEKIELDHVVIQMDKVSFRKAELRLYTRYYFTAKIDSYYKAVSIIGVVALQENFMLQHINLNKLREMPESNLKQPTTYVMTRIHNMMLCKGELYHTKDELVRQVLMTSNDGSVEQFIDECTASYQQSVVNRRDLEEALYA
ncbi:hypothetical protein RKD55_004664 [Rossellomorea marisflavi]